MVSTTARREAVEWLRQTRETSVRRACRVVGRLRKDPRGSPRTEQGDLAEASVGILRSSPNSLAVHVAFSRATMRGGRRTQRLWSRGAVQNTGGTFASSTVPTRWLMWGLEVPVRQGFERFDHVFLTWWWRATSGAKGIESQLFTGFSESA
jgi:hypothetical protein